MTRHLCFNFELVVALKYVILVYLPMQLRITSHSIFYLDLFIDYSVSNFSLPITPKFSGVSFNVFFFFQLGNIECKDCSYFFTTEPAYNRHRTIVHDEGDTYCCSKCDVKCPDKKTLKFHLRVHNPSKKLHLAE